MILRSRSRLIEKRHLSGLGARGKEAIGDLKEQGEARLVMPVYAAEAIVIKQLNFEEASKILTLYTKYQGKVKAIAKGVRRLTSTKTGILDQFNHLRLSLREGRELDIIGEAELLQSFYPLTQKLDRAKRAYQMCELVDQLTPEGQKSPEVFELLEAGLKSLLLDSILVEPLGVGFQFHLLRVLGFWPDPKLIREKKVRQLVYQSQERPLSEFNQPFAQVLLWAKFAGLVSEQLAGVLDGQLKSDRVFLDRFKEDIVG